MLEAGGFAAWTSEQLPLPPDLLTSQDEFLRAWTELEQDQFMGDGGTYRLRRYSRFTLQRGQLRLREGNSIYQSLHDNPLNGGIERTYSPLQPHIASHPILLHWIRRDSELLELGEGPWTVGVHQVRIVARGRELGQPTPEGIHLDGESYTVLHMIGRHNIEGGVFSAYNSDKKPVFHWRQTRLWDTLAFTGTTWHGATPIRARQPEQGDGYRDILLIDFDLSE